MPPRPQRGSRASAPGPAARHIALSSDSDEYDEEVILRCVTCEEEIDPDDVGTCKECCDEANETEKELKREIVDLRSKVNFLKLLSPVDPTLRFNPYSHATTDVVLVASDDSSAALGPAASIHAHKAILAGRSPVFKAMLENDMTESRSGTINIADVSYDALRAFVNYLYTAEASLDDQMACNLLVLAEKYQVKHLKTYSENYLIDRLSCEKAVANYAFAHQHNANKLLDAALEMIIGDMESFIRSEEYADLKESNPHVVVEIFEGYIGKQVNTASPLKL